MNIHRHVFTNPGFGAGVPWYEVLEKGEWIRHEYRMVLGMLGWSKQPARSPLPRDGYKYFENQWYDAVVGTYKPGMSGPLHLSMVHNPQQKVIVSGELIRECDWFLEQAGKVRVRVGAERYGNGELKAVELDLPR